MNEGTQQLVNILERVYPGWHVWVSDEKIWYATWRGAEDRQSSGKAWTPFWLVDELRQPCTVWARDPDALSNELAAEESARMHRILAAQRRAGQYTRESLDGCIHHDAKAPGKAKIDRVTARRNGLI